MLRTALPTLLALGLLAVPAAADSPAAVRAGIEALSGEAAQLRGVRLAQADPGQLAGIVVRLSRIEEELRRLTGRLENLEYGRDQAQDRLDKLVDDLDVRLSRLEGGGTGGSSPAAAPRAEAAREAPPVEPLRAPEPAPAARQAEPAAPVRSAGRAAPTEQDDAAARRGYVLGTLPRDAIMSGGAAATAPRAVDSGAGASAPVPAPRATAPEPQRQAALPRPDTPKGSYDAALALLQSGDFGSAQDEFADFLAAHPQDALAPSAAYWLAETHYVQHDFAGAASQFAKNFQTYGDKAAKAPDNLLKMGMSLAQLGQRDEACRVFDELASRFPNAAPPIKQAAARGRAGAGCG